MNQSSKNSTASLTLVGTCALWAFSFPLLKALEQLGHISVPGSSSVFLSFLLVASRFTVAGAIFLAVLMVIQIRAAKNSLLQPNRFFPTFSKLERQQGVGIGLFGSVGLVLQMDGLAYTEGSISAFLTQGYAVLIPVWVALQHRRLPGWAVTGACLLVCLGTAILAGMTFTHLHLGRGEWETLAGSVFFACQILWLDRPVFRINRSIYVSTLMFLTMGLTCWPIALILAESPAHIFQAYSSPKALLLFGLLTGVCTLVTFPLANHWQPKISATHAGLLYCTEPVFTSAVCLFFPGWISAWTGIPYSNEHLTLSLLVGGSCILAANIWLQISPPATVHHKLSDNHGQDTV